MKKAFSKILILLICAGTVYVCCNAASYYLNGSGEDSDMRRMTAEEEAAAARSKLFGFDDTGKLENTADFVDAKGSSSEADETAAGEKTTTQTAVSDAGNDKTVSDTGEQSVGENTAQPAVTDAGNEKNVSDTGEQGGGENTAQPAVIDAEKETETTQPAVTDAEKETETTQPAVIDAEKETETTQSAVTDAKNETETSEPAVSDAGNDETVSNKDVQDGGDGADQPAGKESEEASDITTDTAIEKPDVKVNVRELIGEGFDENDPKTAARISYILSKNKKMSRDDAVELVIIFEHFAGERDYLDVEVLMGLCMVESGYHPEVGENYIGLMQVSLFYGQRMGYTVGQLWQPYYNIEYACGVLDDINSKMPDDLLCLLTGYNMGYYGMKAKLDAGEPLNSGFYDRVLRYADEITGSYKN